MDINVNLSGLDRLADAISDLAEALKAGVTANEVIAKASTRKPKPAPAPVAEVAPAIPDAPAETPPVAPEPSTPASPSEPAAAQAETVAPAVPAVKGAPTIVEVRAAIAALAKTDKARAIAILQKHGAASVSALKEEFFAAALAEATK